ncbi:MAG: MBL fold metallo-hydrolase [Candidatus Dependentiae bacterium]
MNLKKVFMLSLILWSNLQFCSSSIVMQEHTLKKNAAIKPVIKNGCFFNNKSETTHKHFLDGLGIFWKTKTNTKKYQDTPKHLWQNYEQPIAQSLEPCFTWIGHATFLIQINGFNILTDPVFGNLSVLYKRVMQPGIALEQLPPIHFIILSHNHRDHCDKASLKQLAKHHNPICLVPQGMKKTFTQWGFSNVYEHEWWEHYSFSMSNTPAQTISFTFVPAHHWSQRELTDAHTSLWGGWIIQDNNRNILYFAGDTAYNKEYFDAIVQGFPAIDIAFMPIGPCEPRNLTKHSHVDAYESVKAFLDIGAKQMVPMHWGTFKLGCDSFTDPIKHLTTAWNHCVSDKQKYLRFIKCGQRYTIDV